MNNLLLVIPFCLKDHINAAHLLRWMAELQPEGYKPHSCLLSSDLAVPNNSQRELFNLAKPMFEYTELLRIPVPTDKQNWILGSNFMFDQTARTIADCIKMPWLWCEPDCVPLKPGWLDALAEAYWNSPRRFMGVHMTPKNQPKLPPVYLAGCAIYDAQAYHGMKDFTQGAAAFDIASAHFAVTRSSNSPLFQHFWGKPDLPPTFRETKAENDPENTIPMGYIRPNAVIWHRCKDGTLIDCLRKRMEKVTPESPQPEFHEPESIPAKRGPGRPRKNPELVNT